MVKFDVNLSTGRWPFRPLPGETMPELAAHLRRYGIAGGLLRAAEGAFSSDPESENGLLLKRCGSYPGFIPLLIAHPFYKYWRKWEQVPAAVLYPGFHRYSPESSEALDMAHFLAEKGTHTAVIAVREEDERAQNPLCRIPPVPVDSLNAFASAVPEMTVIALNCYHSEAKALTASNLYCDTAFIEGFPALAPVEEMVQKGKVLFGSHAPFFCVSAALSKITALDEKGKAAMQHTDKWIFDKFHSR